MIVNTDQVASTTFMTHMDGDDWIFHEKATACRSYRNGGLWSRGWSPGGVTWQSVVGRTAQWQQEMSGDVKPEALRAAQREAACAGVPLEHEQICHLAPIGTSSFHAYVGISAQTSGRCWDIGYLPRDYRYPRRHQHGRGGQPPKPGAHVQRANRGKRRTGNQVGFILSD